MKNQKFGFTLIELLVVIVIIGILATISTATFSGYFKKARDTERQTFVRNAQQIILADQISATTQDYEYANVAAVDALLTQQGYAVPDVANGYGYYYWAKDAEFVFVACSEGTDGQVFSAGTSAAAVADVECSGATASLVTSPSIFVSTPTALTW